MNPNDYPQEVINPPQEPNQPLQHPSSAIIAPSSEGSQPNIPTQHPYQAPTTVEPTQPNAATTPPSLPKKKSKWPLIVGILTLVLIVAGAAVAAAILTTEQAPTENKSTPSENKVSAPADAEIINKLQEAIDAPDVLHSEPPLGYKVRGFDYFTVVSSNAAYNISVQRADIEATRNADAIDSILRENNFNAKPIDSQTGNIRYVNYFNDQVFCSRSVDTSPHFASEAKGETIVSVSCIENDTIASTAKQQQPFYESFVVADRERAGFDKYVLGAPSEKESATAGYQIASLPYAEASPAMLIVNSQLLFYKTPGDDTWKFFTASDGMLSCEAYGKNQTVKKAFLGEQCIDQQARSVTTVKL